MVYLIPSAVSFEDLYRLRAPVGTVEGFDISAFDRRVRRHSYVMYMCIHVHACIDVHAGSIC